jgi:hypothetical protein
VITPFGLRHIGLLRELQGTSVVLDPKSVLLEARPTPLQAAVRGYVLRSSGILTYVLHAPADAATWCGFVQARAFASGLAWKVACMAPALDSSEDAATIWYRLLLHLCIAGGERHARRLFACLPQDSPAEEVFRQAGFAVYCHERVFERRRSTPEGKQSGRMRAEQTEDHWHVQRLYYSATPRLVVQAEELSDVRNGSLPFGMPAVDSQQGHVLYGQNGELAGYLQVAVGSQGSWLRLTVHPDMRDAAAEMLDHALALVTGGTPPRVPVLRPASSGTALRAPRGVAGFGGDASPSALYCTVREYEGGIQALLEERGFACVGACSLVAKHTTVHVREPQRKLVPALEKRAGVAPTVSRSESGVVGSG